MATEILRPNGASDETNIASQEPSSGSHYEKVDEASPDDMATLVYTNSASYQRDLYGIADHSVGSGTINSVTVYAYCKSNGATPAQTSLKLAVKSGATTDEGDEKTITDSWAYYSEQWTADPNTGAAWTWSAIDAMQAGLSIRRATSLGLQTLCSQVYIEVDYTSGVAEKTSSDSGSGADSYVSLETGEVKASSDAGSGIEGTPLSSASLAGSESGAGIEAIIARLLASLDVGYGVEASSVESGVLENLFASELGEGSDCLVARIERPIKGGGMRLWT
jgi:hypothetical protein